MTDKLLTFVCHSVIIGIIFVKERILIIIAPTSIPVSNMLQDSLLLYYHGEKNKQDIATEKKIQFRNTPKEGNERLCCIQRDVRCTTIEIF